MYLQQLNFAGLRNLIAATLHFSPKFNVFWGNNGAGKTSVIEAIHLLSTARSFRAHHAEEFISFDEETCVLHGVIASSGADQSRGPVRLGFERSRNTLKMRVLDADCSTIAEFAKHLPIQLINVESYRLLDAPPKLRRQFLDWGLFHVEHSFFPIWQRYHRSLKQRNAAIKKAKYLGEDSVRAWDSELIEAGEQLNSLRASFLLHYETILKEVLDHFLNIGKVSLRFKAGFDIALGLGATLDNYFAKDLSWGYTTQGPHRADVEFLIDEVPAKTLFSRGQLKLFISAMILARAKWFYQTVGKHCIVLIDDLSSELDLHASRLLVEGLYDLGTQVLATVLEKTLVESFLEGKDLKMFHVEHGKIGAEN